MNQDGLPARERLNPWRVRHVEFVELFLSDFADSDRFRKHSSDGGQNCGMFTFRQCRALESF
jgi:hypothetical protein